MTTTFDTAMAAAVGRLLARLGTSATLTRVVDGEYDPIGGGNAPDTRTTYTVKTAPPESIAAAREVQRSLGLGNSASSSASMMVLIETVDTSDAAIPRPDVENDTLTIDGETYKIVEVHEIRSGDDVAAYGLGLSR